MRAGFCQLTQSQRPQRPLTLFPLELGRDRGYFDPGRQKAVSRFRIFMTRVTKVHDFIFLVPIWSQ